MQVWYYIRVGVGVILIKVKECGDSTPVLLNSIIGLHTSALLAYVWLLNILKT